MTSFTRTWNASYEAIPADTDNVSEGALRIRNLKADIHERLVVDHSWAGDANDGAHSKVTLLEQGGNPISAANTGFLYTKDVAGITELFWEDSAGTVLQITTAGILSTTSIAALTQLLTITVGATQRALRLVCNADQANGVILELFHDRTTPGVSDNPAILELYSRDNAGNKQLVGQIRVVYTDVASGTEDSYIALGGSVAGGINEELFIGNGVSIGSENGKGVGTITASVGYYDANLRIFPFSALSTLNASTAAAGDQLICYDISANDYKSVQGQYVGGYVQLSDQNPSNVATLSVDLRFTEFRHFVLYGDYVVPITDAVSLQMRVSTDNGSSFDSGGSDYGYVSLGEASALLAEIGNAAAFIQLNDASALLGNSTGEHFSFIMDIWDPASIAKNPHFYWRAVQRHSTPHITAFSGVGQRYTDQDTTHIQFFMSSGNISSGNFRLYGVR